MIILSLTDHQILSNKAIFIWKQLPFYLETDVNFAVFIWKQT